MVCNLTLLYSNNQTSEIKAVYCQYTGRSRDGGWLTHRVNVVKHLVHSDQLIIQLIIAVRVGQESVTIRDEQIKHIYHLEKHKFTDLTVRKKITDHKNTRIGG